MRLASGEVGGGEGGSLGVVGSHPCQDLSVFVNWGSGLPSLLLCTIAISCLLSEL